MTRSPFYRSRTLSVYGFGTALALYHLQILFPDGPLATELLKSLNYYTLAFCLIIAILLTFLDHLFASLSQVWCSVQDGVIGAVVPTAITLMITSLSLQLWQGQYYEQNHVVVSLQLVSTMALEAAIGLLVVALLGRTTGKLIFLR